MREEIKMASSNNNIKDCVSLRYILLLLIGRVAFIVAGTLLRHFRWSFPMTMKKRKEKNSHCFTQHSKKRCREKRNNNQAVVCPRCSTNRSAIRFKGNTRPPSGLAQRRRRRSKKCSNQNNDHRMYKESKYTVGSERGEMQLMILISHFRSPYAISHQTKPHQVAATLPPSLTPSLYWPCINDPIENGKIKNLSLHPQGSSCC